MRCKVLLIQVIATFFIWSSLNLLYENYIHFTDEVYKFAYYMLIVLVVIYFNRKLRAYLLKDKK
jgi:hypothetical protein